MPHLMRMDIGGWRSPNSEQSPLQLTYGHRGKKPLIPAWKCLRLCAERLGFLRSESVLVTVFSGLDVTPGAPRGWYWRLLGLEV